MQTKEIIPFSCRTFGHKFQFHHPYGDRVLEISYCAKCGLERSVINEMATELFNVKKKTDFIEAGLTPVEDRDCDTCSHDGECCVVMLKCKGYSRIEEVNP